MLRNRSKQCVIGLLDARFVAVFVALGKALNWPRSIVVAVCPTVRLFEEWELHPQPSPAIGVVYRFFSKRAEKLGGHGTLVMLNVTSP